MPDKAGTRHSARRPSGGILRPCSAHTAALELRGTRDTAA